MSPRKVRLAVDLVRGKKIKPALDQLAFSSKWSAKPVIKLIQSAVANAKNNLGLVEDNLYIKDISVDGGATLKRWMPRAQGRATPLKKRTSHINVVLAEIAPSQAKATPKVERLAKPLSVSERPVEEGSLKIGQAAAAENSVEPKPETAEAAKQIVNPARVGQGKHSKIEGGKQGFKTKVFRRKSG